MKQLFLNELSTQPLANNFREAWDRVHRFILTYKNRPDTLFESRICSDCYLGDIRICDDLTLQGFCEDPRGRTLGSLLLGLTKHPYINVDTQQEDQYISSSFFIDKNNELSPTYGLAAAYLHKSIGISFYSEEFWGNFLFQLIVCNDETTTTNPIISVSSPEHFMSTDFLNWEEKKSPLILVTTDIDHNNKKINLRDDHGLDVLTAFAHRIRRSPYVIEVVNSLPFNPKSNNFINAIYENGLIEIVLTSTEAGYGMVLRTTGRNLTETSHIAEILNQEYSS